MGYVQQLAAWIRQMRYPQEFRIDAPVLPASLQDSLLAVARALEAPAAPRDAGGATIRDAGSSAPQPADPDFRPFLAELATAVWRLRQKMTRQNSDEPLEEMRRPFRHLESVSDSLTQIGVQIHDPVNSRYASGMALKVIAFQPTPGFRAERVIETLRPSVFFRRERIQMGEVIVGTPQNGAPAAKQ